MLSELYDKTIAFAIIKFRDAVYAFYYSIYMSLNATWTFETIESKSKALTIGSAIGYLASEALLSGSFVGDLFGFFTKLGILGRATGWMGKKFTEDK